MAPNIISALSQFQIDNFFLQNPSVTQERCDTEAEEITGQPVTPTLSQGGTSYTVAGGLLVVQFRTPSSNLDMELLEDIEQAYRGFVPHHEYRGKLGQVNIYTMNNVGGICMYLARRELQSNNCHLLRVTLDDYAGFFASAYHNTPVRMARPDSTQLLDKFSSQLRQLRQELPVHFHPKLDEIMPELPSLFTKGWPLVPNHIDLLENNIHVDTATGRIAGICDWRGAEVSPFGLSLGWVEIMLGTLTTSGDFWRYHPNHGELRDHFWARFYHHLGRAYVEDKRRIEVARLIGLFLSNCFQGGEVAVDGSEELGFLGAVLRFGTLPTCGHWKQFSSCHPLKQEVHVSVKC